MVDLVVSGVEPSGSVATVIMTIRRYKIYNIYYLFKGRGKWERHVNKKKMI
jgi:hypothetical protein